MEQMSDSTAQKLQGALITSAELLRQTSNDALLLDNVKKQIREVRTMNFSPEQSEVTAAILEYCEKIVGKVQTGMLLMDQLS